MNRENKILEVVEFERIVSRGLGRAILHLQKHDAAPYRDAILRCCLHNTAFDPQIEGFRSLYIYDIIQLTGDMPFYRNEILKALAAASPEDFNREAQHLFTMVWRFVAEDDDQDARQALYDKYRSCYMTGNTAFGDYDLVYMDGVKAFLFLLDPLQKGIYPDSDSIDEYAYRLSWLEDDDKISPAVHALNAVSKGNPRLRQFLTQLCLFRRQQESRRNNRESGNPDPAKLTYADIRPKIDEGKAPAMFSFWRRWGENASDADLLAAAQDFMRVENPRSALAYLSIFNRRTFPLEDFSRLFYFARQNTANNNDYVTSQVSYRAITALENVTHPSVRQFALDMIAANNDPGSMAGILQSNFETGDWLFLEKLSHTITDKYDYHSLGMSIRDIFKKHPSKDAIPTLLQMYEHAPCSHCREGFVKNLVSLDAVPGWMAEECKYDSNEDLREFAMRGFKDETLDD